MISAVLPMIAAEMIATEKIVAGRNSCAQSSSTCASGVDDHSPAWISERQLATSKVGLPGT
jgi:hypothetical protein